MAASAAPSSTPRLGRFELLRLLGKSARSMVWRVNDQRSRQEWILVLPRTQPEDPKAQEQWMNRVRKAARLNHPHLAEAVEVGAEERWPYVAYEGARLQTLTERLTPQGLPALDVARWMVQALDGLAFAHEAGVAHRDLQLHMMLVGEQGNLRLIGFEVAPEDMAFPGDEAKGAGRSMSVDPSELKAQRDAAHRDVLAAGLAMHHLLAGQPALGEADVSQVILRLPPWGQEFVRLPWGMARPVAEPLRAIVNRSTERQERQRYRNARTLARALSGWMEADSAAGGGPLGLLLDRVRAVGLLPAMPGGTVRASQLLRMERERTNELAEIVLRDLALAFELLRAVNTASVRGTQVSGNGPVLTVRRAIAMIGLEGVLRVSQALRPWPGLLDEQGAKDLERLFERVKRAGRVAQVLRPAGYDAEVVYLVTLLQNLGRLTLQYHFPDEAAQIRRLMLPAPAAKAGEPDEPGMTEENAAFAVMGVDAETLGAAVARHWGMDEGVLQMIRRLPTNTPVRAADDDEAVLRAVSSCANEVVDAMLLPASQAATALQRVAQRYARTLGVTLRVLQDALKGAMHEPERFDDAVPMARTPQGPAGTRETTTGDLA
jgi:non-specific serine/threonine protein kinase